MDVRIGDRWQSFIATAVEGGRYVSADDVVTEALHLLQDREERWRHLRDMIDAAIAENVWYTDEEVAVALDAALDKHSVTRTRP